MTLTDVGNRIKAYLPQFVTVNDLLQAVVDSMAQEILAVFNAIAALTDTNYTGKGAKLEAKDWKLFPSGNEALATLQSYLSSRYTILQQRGTTTGITNDVRRVSGDGAAAVNVLADTGSGWWMEGTFPDIGNPKAFLDAGKIVEITMSNKSVYSDAELKRIIQHDLIPINFTTIYL